MSQMMNDMREQIRILERRPTTTSGVHPAQEPHTSDPEYFDGRRSTLRNFLAQCRIVFLAQPSRFPTERHKVIYASSYLRDVAFAWFQPFLDTIDHEKPNAMLESFVCFSNALQEAFGDPDRKRTAENKLTLLRQVTSAATYSAEFKRLAVDTDWNDPALCFQYYRGLKEALKDELAKLPRVECLDVLMDLCIRLDTRLHERRLEKHHNPSHGTAINHTIMHPMITRHHPPAATPAPVPNRMELDAVQERRGPLTEDEKQRRRRLGLCLYCGLAGHQANACASRPQSRLQATLNGRNESIDLYELAYLKGEGQEH